MICPAQFSEIFLGKSAYLISLLVNKSVKAGGKQCKNPQIWVALYGTQLSVLLSDSTGPPGIVRDSTGTPDVFLQVSKRPLPMVSVPSLQSVPSSPSSFGLWLARRWPALTQVTIIDNCHDMGSALDNILANCKSSISGSISGPEIMLHVGVYHLVHSFVSIAAV